MSKFGELITANVPVLINFYTDWNEKSENMKPVIRDVAAEMEETVKVISIDVDKNEDLANALRIKNLPTLMIYNEGQMVFRNSGELTKEEIIMLLKEQIV